MQDLSTLLTSLSITAALALSVERTLEVLKHFMESETGYVRRGDQKVAIKQTDEAIKEAKTAALKVTQTKTPVTKVRAQAVDIIPELQATPPPGTIQAQVAADSESEEQFPPPQILVIPPARPVPFAAARNLFFQLGAAGLGMILAGIFDLKLLSVFLEGFPSFFKDYSGLARDWYNAMDILFTGLIIGGGSQPIHILIRFLSERKITVDTQQPELTESLKVPAVTKDVSSTPAKEPSALDWIDIDYKGGVQPERLEAAHLRTDNPNLIIYHHTAMASFSSFQDVVDEFLVNKKWLTGYHCVVMPDGGIRPFCRWDRFGNHAKGRNMRSLGIALHGNFHTLTDDKYGNSDGRYGNKAPTAAQLRAAARVVALWTYLYDDIELDFESAILPHRQALPNHTVCPGSNFPYETFQKLIRGFYEAWAEQAAAQEAIKNFKNRKFIYVV